jgi:hypothetical protein
MGSLRNTGSCSGSQSRYLGCPLQTSETFQGKKKKSKNV